MTRVTGQWPDSDDLRPCPIMTRPNHYLHWLFDDPIPIQPGDHWSDIINPIPLTWLFIVCSDWQIVWPVVTVLFDILHSHYFDTFWLFKWVHLTITVCCPHCVSHSVSAFVGGDVVAIYIVVDICIYIDTNYIGGHWYIVVVTFLLIWYSCCCYIRYLFEPRCCYISMMMICYCQPH